MLRQITTGLSTDIQDRLWFSDHDHDLFVWLSDDGEHHRFQFSYNKSSAEHALQWHREQGYTHYKVDTGETDPSHYKMTPIFLADGEFSAQQLAERFKQISSSLDTELANFIYQKLMAFPQASH